MNYLKKLFLEIEYVKLFVDHGADVYAKAHVDDREVTALDLASSSECKLMNRTTKYTFYLSLFFQSYSAEIPRKQNGFHGMAQDNLVINSAHCNDSRVSIKSFKLFN